MGFRIFISHSSHSAEALQFTLQLRDEFEKAGYKVLLDRKELRASDDWTKEIHEWLASCHAGVVLLTPDSVTRPWVLKEATILTWRHSLQPEFKLFPYLAEGVTEALLEEQKFSPLLIGSIQQITGRTPSAIAAEIKQVVGKIEHQDTPLDKLADTLSDILEHAGPATVQRLARRLGVDLSVWNPRTQPEFRPVRLIAGRIVSEDLGDYESVDKLLEDLLPAMLKEWCQKTLAIVAPYWVPAEAAARLTEIAGREGRRAIVMNGKYLQRFTAEMYVLRAFPLCQQRHVKLPGGGSENAIDESIEDIYQALENLWNMSREDVKEQLQDPADPVFVPLPAYLSDRQTLEKLQGVFSKLIFILNAGDNTEKLEALARIPNVEAVLPPVDLAREKKLYFAYQRAEGMLNRRP